MTRSSTVHVIIGGGAAGVFAAIRCKHIDPSSTVLLLEKSNQLLSKVRISGGGRCNVTHACFDPIQLAAHYPRGSKELVGPFHAFQPKDTISWFAEHGVILKTESDGRMFPTTDSSATIIECLMREASRTGVTIQKQQTILSMGKVGKQFHIQLKDQQIIADHVLLATGSSSWGYMIAKELGHEIVDPVPSLFTFNVPTSPLLDLAGISVSDVILTLKDVSFCQRGPLLLTHWGFSGPAVLKLSAWAARQLHELDYKTTLHINWTASENQQVLYQHLLQRKTMHPSQTLPSLLPHHLLHRLCANLNIDFACPLGKLTNKTLGLIASKLHADAYTIEGKTTYKQEFVTAGGVNLKEINFKTMQSRKMPGLFFAGEILNIDGITGGFNFQNAWTTGWLAGTAMGKKLL